MSKILVKTLYSAYYSILCFVIAEALFRRYPEAREGKLTRMRASLVRGQSLSQLARRLQLGETIRFGSGERKSGGRRRDSILADAMEAVIAAVYIDGGLLSAQNLILKLWGKRIEAVKSDARDAKTALQEWAQARGLNPPSYKIISREGPDHAPVFEIEVCLETGEKKKK